MDNVIAARALMGISLDFHIISATIGIGLPLMLMLAEGLSLRTGDELYHRMARRWIHPAGLLFAIGAVSGTILSFELGFFRQICDENRENLKKAGKGLFASLHAREFPKASRLSLLLQVFL